MTASGNGDATKAIGASGDLAIYGQKKQSGSLSVASERNSGIHVAGGSLNIVGGTVSATGTSAGIYASGDIVLGWTDAANNRVTASSFNSESGNVKIANGKSFKDESGNYYSGSLTSGQLDVLAGKTLTPVSANAPVVVFTDANQNNHAILNGAYTGNEALEIPDDVDVKSVVFQRSFNTEGFSTLMLPFAFDAANIEGVESVIKFSGMIQDGKGKDAVGMSYIWCSAEVEASLKEATPDKYIHCNSDKKKYPGVLNPYTPYMVLMKSSALGFKVDADAMVTLVSSEQKDGVAHPTVKKCKDESTADESCDWELRGTFSYTDWQDGDDNLGKVWGFNAQPIVKDGPIGKFTMFGPKGWVPAMRAYLYNPYGEPLKPVQIARAANGVAYAGPAIANNETASIDVVIVDSDENGNERTTVIGTLDRRTGEIRLTPRPKHTYDLKGRRVNESRKASKGVYVEK